MDAMKTGALIAQARKEKGLTQRELAEQVYVSVQAVSKWELGKNFPDLPLMEPLAEALGLTVTELLAGQRGEEPGEEAVRDSLRLGLAQLGPKVRRWRWLFLLAAVLLLAVLAGFGYVWVRDNTRLIPRRETVVRPVDVTSRETTLVHAAGKGMACLFQAELADDVEQCSFRWELWTRQGLENSWDAGEQLRQDRERRKLVGVTFSSAWRSAEFQYGISLESPRGTYVHGLEGTLEVPYMGDGYGISSLEEKAAVDREEGVVLLALTLNKDGELRTRDIARNESGRVDHLPEDERTAHLLLRMYCE